MAGNRVLKESVSAVAFSKAKQSDFDTAQTLGFAFETDRAVVTNMSSLHEQLNNAESLSGGMEPDRFWRGNIKPKTLDVTWPKASANDFGFVFAAGYGNPSAASQMGTTGIYKNACSTKPASQYAMPMITGCGRVGDETNGVSKTLLYALQCSKFGYSWSTKESNIKLSASFQVPGKYKTNIRRQIVKASTRATSLTLVGDAVHDSSTPTASVRLNSVHTVKSDPWGEGGTLHNCNFTAVSDATPAVITIVPTLNLLDQIYKTVSNVLTDYSDGSSAIVFNISTTNKVYIGSKRRFNAIDFTKTVSNVLDVTAAVKFFASDGTWTAVGDLVDTTYSSGTLAASGTLFWNMPTTWEPTMLPTGNAEMAGIKRQDMYWIELTASGATTATTAGTLQISRYEDAAEVLFDDDGSFTDYTDEAAAMDGDEFPAVTITTSEDVVYFRAANASCARIFLEIGDTPNDVAASTMDVLYYNGTAFVTATPTDGTDPGDGVSMSQSGAVTWTQPTDHVQSTISDGVNDNTGYWFQIVWDKSLKAGAYIEGLRVGDRYIDHEVVYRVSESVNFTEGATFPDEVVEPAFSVDGLALFLGTRFNTDLTDFEGGQQITCEQQSGEFMGEWDHGEPEFCIDGTQTQYAQRLQQGDLKQTLKISLKTDKATWAELQRYRDFNLSNTHLESVKTMSIGIRITGTQISETNDYLRYRFMHVLPLAAFNVSGEKFTDKKYSVDLEFTIGEDTVNDYRSGYSCVINEEATGYAQ